MNTLLLAFVIVPIAFSLTTGLIYWLLGIK
jgi:hypothetical protein